MNFDNTPIFIAGPCSAESEEQVLRTAEGVKAAGVSIFRAGIWKPRTHPGCFEGIGTEGLTWMARAKRETGMKTATEVASGKHVELCLENGMDIVWIGARTTVNPFLVQEIADALKGSGIPVFVKNPVNPDLDLWTGAVERLQRAGIADIGLIHRGFTPSSSTIYRNDTQWSMAIAMRRRFPILPMLCDPSHIAGKKEYVSELSQTAMDLGLDGLMVETHVCPSCAMSDASQQLTPSELASLLSSLRHRTNSDNDTTIRDFRLEFDEIDSQLISLLSRRMELSRKIGRYKKDNGIAILQLERWEEVLDNAVKSAGNGRLDEKFIEDIFNRIHLASIREQG